MRTKSVIRPELIPVSVAWSDYEYFYSPLNGMLVHHRVISLVPIHTPGWREEQWELSILSKNITQCLRTARSEVEPTNHETTEPLISFKKSILNTADTLLFLFALPSLRDDCCLGNHWSCDSSSGHRHHCTSVQDKTCKHEDKTGNSVSAYKVYQTSPSHIINNLCNVTSLVEINHVIDPAERSLSLTYSVNWHGLESIQWSRALLY